MGETEQLKRIRDFCNGVSEQTMWDAYDLACEIRDFIDGDYTGNVIAP